MEITKLSTRGQIVLPEAIRKNIESGTAFMVSKQNNLIILKQLDGLTKKEIGEIKELDKIWKDVDSGNCESYEAEEFFKKMKEW